MGLVGWLVLEVLLERKEGEEKVEKKMEVSFWDELLNFHFFVLVGFAYGSYNNGRLGGRFYFD